MILTFDTSLADLHIGLFSGDGSSLGEYHHESSPQERHLFDALLAKKTSELLRSVSAKAKDISTIAFINGPGSFTGLRIGLSFAKGIAFGSDAKLRPLIAHTVLLEEYCKTNKLRERTAILYPGYEKESVYLADASEPEKISYVRITNIASRNFAEIICTKELSEIQLPKHIVKIELKTMADLAISPKRRDLGKEDISSLEPFYGTDFKTT